MKIYYARPVNLYNSGQDKRDIELMEKLGFEVFGKIENFPETYTRYFLVKRLL